MSFNSMFDISNISKVQLVMKNIDTRYRETKCVTNKNEKYTTKLYGGVQKTFQIYFANIFKYQLQIKSAHSVIIQNLRFV